MGQFIVTIGRQYGSQGHDIATKLGEKLGVPVYDKSIRDHLVEEGFDKEIVENYDEKVRTLFFSQKVHGLSNSIEEIVAQKEFDYEKELAASGNSFIIVGRCSDFVLKDNPNVVKIFILGDHEFKKQHLIKDLGMSEDEAEDKMKIIDKKRKHYHNSYSDIKWGDSRGYDLTINSSKLGIDNTVEYIYDYLKISGKI